jgi:hypothetical protein
MVLLLNNLNIKKPRLGDVTMLVAFLGGASDYGACGTDRNLHDGDWLRVEVLETLRGSRTSTANLNARVYKIALFEREQHM